jgi:hypothetical protein
MCPVQLPHYYHHSRSVSTTTTTTTTTEQAALMVGLIPYIALSSCASPLFGFSINDDGLVAWSFLFLVRRRTGSKKPAYLVPSH